MINSPAKPRKHEIPYGMTGYDISVEKLEHYIGTLKYESAILTTSPTSYEIIGERISKSLPAKASVVIKEKASLARAEDYIVGCRDNLGILII